MANLRLLAFLLLAVPAAFSQSQFLYPNMIFTVAFLTVLLIALTYMGGKAFRIPQWEAYLNVEVYNLVIAIFTVGIMFAALQGSIMISRSLVGDDPIAASKLFLGTIINKGVMPMYKDLLIIESGAAMSSSFMLRVGPGVWSSVHKAVPGTDAILSISRLMSFGLLAIYASLSSQYIALSVIEFAMPIVMSIGIITFVFPPTREAGAFLICFAFAFQVVFPTVYALSQLVLEDMYGSPYQAYLPTIFGLQVRGASVMAFFSPFAPFGLNFEALIPFINAMAHLALVSLFVPGLAMIITISMISSISKFLLGKT